MISNRMIGTADSLAEQEEVWEEDFLTICSEDLIK